MSIFCSAPGCDRQARSRSFCMRHYQQKMNSGELRKLTARDRFEAKVNRNGPVPGYRADLGPCWIWGGGTLSDSGYGRLERKTGSVLVHRFTYETFIGPVPDDLELDHLCRVRKCCNPAHLEPVTHRVNSLRGETIPARNAAKTHCPQAHRYDPTNTNDYTRTGQRYCKACIRERGRKRRDEERRGLRTPGICPRCKAAPRAPGRSYCSPCAVAVNRRSAVK